MGKNQDHIQDNDEEKSGSYTRQWRGRIRIIYKTVTGKIQDHIQDSDGEESGSYIRVTGKNQDHIQDTLYIIWITIVHYKQRTSCLSNCLKGFSLGIFIKKKGAWYFFGESKNSNFAVVNKNLSFIKSSCL